MIELKRYKNSIFNCDFCDNRAEYELTFELRIKVTKNNTGFCHYYFCDEHLNKFINEIDEEYLNLKEENNA